MTRAGRIKECIRGWLNTALGFFYPKICQLCGFKPAAPADGFVCADCRGEVRFIHAPFCRRCGLPFDGSLTTPFECANCREMDLHFSTARSAAVARTTVLEAVHRYKYRRHLWFEPFLAGLLVDAALPALRAEKWDAIVPVPLHPLKEREREFNQAVRLAGHLSRASAIPMQTGWLRRALPTTTQTRLSRQERTANVRGAFVARSGIKLNRERVVLVDDVFTTGATTSACARALRQAGAGEVCVWTVARGL
ncbi:MAG: ComF family protein [Verrucomicrobia bacterium]|nr:ComF family protein [Verrucomicrobiota bacterium]MDE3098752.1 ComF family protein [Verrucomicrobiota bacterium]